MVNHKPVAVTTISDIESVPGSPSSVDDYVMLTTPSGAPAGTASSVSAPKELAIPHRLPATPPSGPDTPGSMFGGPAGAGPGGAVLVVAALVASLSLFFLQFAAYVSVRINVPRTQRRTLSLERPG